MQGSEFGAWDLKFEICESRGADGPDLPSHSSRARVAAVAGAVDAMLTLQASRIVIIGR